MLRPGERGFVVGITAEGAMKRHFLDMGITTGVPITLERVAPFGDPVAVRVGLAGDAAAGQRAAQAAKVGPQHCA